MIKLATILNKQTCNGLKMYRNEWMTEIPSEFCVASDLCEPVLDLFYAFHAIVFQKKKKI